MIPGLFVVLLLCFELFGVLRLVERLRGRAERVEVIGIEVARSLQALPAIGIGQDSPVLQENRLHKEVCDGAMTLHDASHLIAVNWLRAYQHAFG